MDMPPSFKSVGTCRLALLSVTYDLPAAVVLSV
jgi:hypothetical protein